MTTSTLNTSVPITLHTTTCGSRRVPFLPFSRISARAIIWSLLLGIALISPALLFLTLFPVSATTQHNNLQIALFPIMAVVMHVLLGPLLEEVVYRGLFLQLTRRYLPSSIAIILSSAIFAITHLPRGMGTVLVAFPMGCLFAWMVTRSGSLWPGLLCHAVFNYSAYFIVAPMFGISGNVMAHSSDTILPLTGLFLGGWIVLSVFMAVISFVMLTRNLTRRNTFAGADARHVTDAK